MTPDDIKAYLSLGERFRATKLRMDAVGGWFYGSSIIRRQEGDEVAERLARDSMLVGLIQMRDVKIWHATHGGDAYVVVLNRIEVSRMSTLFNALLAACQAVDAAEKENNHE